MQVEHLQLRQPLGGDRRVDDGVGRDVRMAEHRDRVVDGPDDEARLEPEPRHGCGEQTAERHAAQHAQDGRRRVAVEVARSQPRQRQQRGDEDGESRPRTTDGPGQRHSREGGYRDEREPAEGRRERRPLRVGDHYDDQDERGERRTGAGREAPSGRREPVAGQRDQPGLCGDERRVGRHERDHVLPASAGIGSSPSLKLISQPRGPRTRSTETVVPG